MTYRQRNIPVATKEESESQTDIRLLESYLLDARNQEEQRRTSQTTIKLSEVYSSSGLLRPFGDHHLLKEFSKGLQQLKELPYDEKLFGKRLQILESQISGLLKRDFLIHGSAEGSQSWSSYYSTLNQKEKEVIRLSREKIYSDLKVVRLEERIKALEQEVQQLRVSLVHSQEALQENKIYSEFYKKIKTIIETSERKGTDIQVAFNQQVLPTYTEFNYNLNALTRIINKDVSINIRPLTLSLAKVFDKNLKEPNFNEDKLEQSVLSLLENFRALRGVDYLKGQFDKAQRTEMAENNYRSIISLFNHEIEELKSTQPNLKGAERLDWLLRKLEDEKVDLVAINGWMNLATSEIRVRQIKSEDKQLRELLGSLAGEFKRVYTRFPELKKHCSASFIEIMNSQVLLELIEGGSIERLKEIIVHEVETVKVDNIYSYENTKDAKLIFHLRVLIKSLLEELYKVKEQYNIELSLDEAILALLKQQCIDGINVEEIIGLFRPPARYIEVPIVIQNKVFQSNTYEKSVPINKSKPIVISQEKLQVVTVNKEVPIYIENPVDHVIQSQVPVQIITEKLVQAPVDKEVIVQRILEEIKEVPTIVQKVVPVYEKEEIVKEIQIDRVIKDIEVRQIQKLVEVKVQQIKEIEKIVEKAVIANEFKELIKEVEVKVPIVITKTQILEIEKKIPYIIEKEIPIEVKSEVAVQIRVPEIQFIELVEYRDKPIVKTHTIEKEVPVELKVEKQIIKEVPKEIFIDRSHFIKGDKEEVIREVEVFIDKPIIQQVLKTKELQVQKIVPLYITEQVPIIERISEPYFSEKVKEVEVQKVKIVTAKQQIVKPIEIDKPVPIIVEKEIIKVQPQFIDRIIEKIVEVPRIVEVQKIVQKIVVVPRIVQKIVEVPKIIEKIVICKEIELQIVEIPVPQIIIQEVEVPIEVPVEKTVIVREKQIQKVDLPIIVQQKTIEQKLVEVPVEKQVSVEVIREVAVQTYRDRIEYQKVEIHETKVETIEVQVPVIVQEKVPFVVQKEIILHEIIQEPTFEKIIYEKEKPVIIVQEKLVVHDIITEKPIIQKEVVEVPGPETIVRLNDPVEVEVIRQKLVKENQYVEIIKEVVLEQEKIVPLIHERIISVPINELVTTPQLIEVPKLVNLVHYKEVPVAVPVREERVESRIVQDVISVEKIVEKPIEIEISREKIKEVVKEIKSIVKEETIKQIKQEVQILIPTETKIVEVPGETIIQQLRSEIKTVEVEDKAYEKLVQKIVMLPQIVEIVKNIHHIAEVNQLGIAVDTDVNIQTEKFLGVSTELKQSLVDLLGTFRSNVGRQPDLKNLIVIIEKYLKFIDDWIAFPKLVEVPKEVIKEVQKERLVIVPTKDKEKESTLCYILEKLLNELKRIKQSHKITLNIEDDIQKLFFSERRGEEDLDRKYEELQEELRTKYSSFGSWSESHPFLVSSFLQDHLSLQALIDDANRAQKVQTEQISHLRHQLELSSSKYNHLLCYNRKMLDDNNSLIKILEKYKSSIEGEEYESNVRTHREFYQELITGKLPIFLSSIQRFSQFADSEIRSQQPEGLAIQNEAYVSQLVSKLNKYQAQNQSFLKKSRALESQITKYTDQLSVKNSIIRRLETDFESKLSRAKEELSKSPDVSRDIIDQNRKLLERSRVLERQATTEKANLEKAKRDFQRALESQKRDLNRELQRKEREIKESSDKAKKDFERELRNLSTEMEKLKRVKERLEDELNEIKRRHTEEIKTIREQQMSGATDKNNQLINENLQLRKKSDKIEAEYEKLKKAAIENNSVNERETQKLKTQIERLQIEMKGWEKKHKEGFLDLPQQTQIINKNIELEKKIKIMETDLSKLRQKDSSSNSQLRNLKDKVKNLEIELDVAKREVEASQKMKSTTYQSGYKSGIGSEFAVESSLARSPGGPIYKSQERGFVSPQSVQSQERIQELGSSSSRFSQESSEEKSVYKSQMSLREFMEIKQTDEKDSDVYTTYVMIKIIEAIEKEAENGVYHSYSPSNIYLHNFNVKKLDSLVVKFGAHIINKNNKTDGLYLAPEVLGGSVSTKKSVVFCLGVILDELIHGEPFFRSMEEIQNAHIEFKVRGEKLNPILKNTLFEMMNKEPGKRLELIEAKRRLSLQKYITSEGRSSVTQQRLSRRREE